MTSEYRVVFFDDREIVMALIEHARTQGTKLPAGKANKLEIDRATLTAKLGFARRGSPNEAPIEFNSAALAQALIRYCKKAGIPLPVKSNKELRVMDDRVAFIVDLQRAPADALVPVEYE